MGSENIKAVIGSNRTETYPTVVTVFHPGFNDNIVRRRIGPCVQIPGKDHPAAPANRLDAVNDELSTPGAGFRTHMAEMGVIKMNLFIALLVFQDNIGTYPLDKRIPPHRGFRWRFR